MVEGDEHEDGSVNKLTHDGTYIVAHPEILFFRNTFHEREREYVHMLGNEE